MPCPDRLPDHLARAVADPKCYADMDTCVGPSPSVIPIIRSPAPSCPTTSRSGRTACKFDDIQSIARQNGVFLSSLGALTPRASALGPTDQGFRSIVGMNPPDHGKCSPTTRVGSAEEHPQAEADVRAWRGRYVDQVMSEAGGELDFVGEIAVHYLLMMAILGFPMRTSR